MIGIRGAIAEVKNTSEEIIQSSKNLFTEILEVNNLEIDKIISVIFTLAHDLTEAFPAKALREHGHTAITAIDTITHSIEYDLVG